MTVINGDSGGRLDRDELTGILMQAEVGKGCCVRLLTGYTQYAPC